MSLGADLPAEILLPVELRGSGQLLHRCEVLWRQTPIIRSTAPFAYEAAFRSEEPGPAWMDAKILETRGPPGSPDGAQGRIYSRTDFDGLYDAWLAAHALFDPSRMSIRIAGFDDAPASSANIQTGHAWDQFGRGAAQARMPLLKISALRELLSLREARELATLLPAPEGIAAPQRPRM